MFKKIKRSNPSIHFVSTQNTQDEREDTFIQDNFVENGEIKVFEKPLVLSDSERSDGIVSKDSGGIKKSGFILPLTVIIVFAISSLVIRLLNRATALVPVQRLVFDREQAKPV